MQHSAPSSNRNSHKEKINKPALTSFKLSSYQLHHSNTTLNIPAVSHNDHRKISKTDTNKSSGSSEFVHFTSGECAFLSAYTSSLCGLTMFHAREKRWVSTSNPVQPSAPVWNEGTKRLYDTLLDKVAVFSVLRELTGRGQVRVAAVNLLHLRPDSVTAIFPGFIWDFSHAQRPINKIGS